LEYSEAYNLYRSQDPFSEPWWKDSTELFAGRFNIVAAYQGGMSEVYICKDKYNSRLVAAKTSHFSSDLFSREARLWLGLGSHPNIVRAHTVMACKTPKSNYEQYLFMDFIGDKQGNSRNLKQGFRESRNKLDFIINTAYSAINALEHARSVFPNFVHRDLKPDNILVSDDGNIFVTDFGIGHLLHDTAVIPSSTNNSHLVNGNTIFNESGCFIGTFGYASPEQYLDSSSVTLKTDIYSIGVILYEMLTGELPFNPQQIRQHGYQILSIPIIPPQDSLSQTPELWQIILKMLCYKIEDRYSSFEAIRADLDGLKCRVGVANNGVVAVKVDKETLFNRAYSFIELNKNEIAVESFFNYRKRFPFTAFNSNLARSLYSKLPTDSSKQFLQKVMISEFTDKYQLAKNFVGLSLVTLTVCVSLVDAQRSQLIMAVVLLAALYIENILNLYTEIDFDEITLGGSLAGLVTSGLVSILGYKPLSGSFLYSIIGCVIGLIIPLGFAYTYQAVTKKEGIGGGTIKLSAMIGSWVGLTIIPITIVSCVLLLIQGLILAGLHLLPGDLKWSKNTLIPRLHNKFRSIPTSAAITLATLLTFYLTARKVIPF
jgi:serine/threonine protein kinase